MHDGHRHARLEQRIGQRERGCEASVKLAGDERRHGITAAGEADPFDVIALAHVFEHIGLLLHEQMRADRDMCADADLDFVLSECRLAYENGSARDQ